MEGKKANWTHQERRPRVEMKFKISKNRKYIIAQETSSWIFPVNYVSKILEAAKTGGVHAQKV